MPRAIFFDIDDTLFPSTEFAESARRNAVRAMIGMGIPGSEDDLYRLLISIIREKGSNYPGHFDLLCKRLKVRRPARFIAAAVAAYHDTKTSIQPFPLVPRTLLSLRDSGIKLYIASNGNAIKQWDKLIRLRLALYFDDVFVSGELGEEKSPSFFRRVLRILRMKPGECVMVGDREDTDIRPAREVGMITIRVRKGKESDRGSAADFEVDEVSGITEIIKSRKSKVL